MPETKKTLKVLGFDLPVTDVPIKSAVEFFNEYVLEDGSVIKVKATASSFMRVDGQFLADGKPIYIVLTAPAVNVISSPEALERPLKPKVN